MAQGPPGASAKPVAVPDRIIVGDAVNVLSELRDESARCCVTSPPYWGLRDYDTEDQLGAEAIVDTYVERLCAIFDEVRRVLRSDGTCWLNLGGFIHERQPALARTR